MYGGNENLEAIEFFKHLNTRGGRTEPGRCHDRRGIHRMAEGDGQGRSTADSNFSLKWNMGWMHDFLEYMKLDPYFRKYNHNKMTFAMMYAYA